MMNRDENKYMVFYRIINGLVLFIYIYIIYWMTLVVKQP